MEISQSTDLERVFSKLNEKFVSVYTNEFDLSFFRVFFPEIGSKIGYLPNSVAFTNSLTPDIAILHSISVSRNPFDSPLFSSVQREGNLFIHVLKTKPEVKETDEKNKLVDYPYISSVFPPGNTKPLQITTVGVYSVTPASYSRELCEYIKKKGKVYSTVFDATACVGGDTIGFALFLNARVISLERDETNFKALENNISAYPELEYKITAIQGDFLEEGDKILDKYRPQLVYFDPPWGGKDYMKNKNIELFLGDKNVKEIVKRVLQKFPFVREVVMKVPFNFNLSDVDVEILKMKKFNVVFFKRTDDSTSFNTTKLTETSSSDLKIPPPSIKYLQTVLTPDYPMSPWVPQEKYKRPRTLPPALYNMIYRNIHWGQRKLHLSEVDFFLSYTTTTDKYVVVYAGAANGQHIPLLFKMFPNVEFHLYDPAPFSPLVTSRPDLFKINLYKDSSLPVGFFTNEVAEHYKGIDNLLFICDIRLAPSISKGDEKYAELFEENVDNDMKIQRDWVEIMRPKFSILKMRLPYYQKDPYEYLAGDVRFQIWAPVTSTETRLVVKRNNDGGFSTAKYDPKVYEQQCAYFNNQMRQMDISRVTFKELGIEGVTGCKDDCDLKSPWGEYGILINADCYLKSLWGEYGILINADCYLETVVLCGYLDRIGKEKTIRSIKTLIDEMSSWLYEDIPPKKAFLEKERINKHKKSRGM
jgi:predicted RNA methylase